eukprot:m.225328 g.225328  ORF g.225328 m.225328 type:complete len:122 (+) comp40012_c0_seq43:360-725(+)
MHFISAFGLKSRQLLWPVFMEFQHMPRKTRKVIFRPKSTSLRPYLTTLGCFNSLRIPVWRCWDPFCLTERKRHHFSFFSALFHLRIKPDLLQGDYFASSAPGNSGDDGFYGRRGIFTKTRL